MNSKTTKGILILALVFMAGCVGVEPISLETRSDAPIYKPSEYVGNVLAEGVMYDFRGGLGEWWWDTKYTILKQGAAMKIMVKGAGPGYEPFGIEIEESDFTNTPVIRLRMKLDEKTTDLPLMRIDLRDKNGLMTNGAPPSHIVKKSDDYVEYYFDYNYKWAQGWPEAAEVDKTKIDGLQVFINPGGKAFTGTILIDEIYLMANKDGSGVVSTDIVIDDFGGATDLWWPCKKEKTTVSKRGDDNLNIHFDDAQWECFGKVFGDVDVTNNQIIKIRARAESETPVKSTNIMARFIDVNENSSDLIDGENMSDLEVGGADFKEYFSVFTDQLYSSTGDFDAEHVNRVIIFVNMNKEANFTGDVILDEIAFVSRLPKKVESQRANKWGPTPTFSRDWAMGATVGKIEGMKWEASSSAISVADADGGVKLSCKGAGPAWDKVTASFGGSNIAKNSFLKVVAKASGSKKPTLRFHMIDNVGVIANGRPQDIEVATGGDYEEYYIKMGNNFFQRYPEFKIVNGQSIEKFEVFVNGGLSAFDGEVSIKEITAVNDEDVPEDWFEKLKIR